MSDTNAINSIGVKFRKWNTSTAVWDDYAEITSLTPFEKSRDTIEVTDITSTDGYKKFIGAFREGGEVSLTLNFTRSAFDDFNDDFDSNNTQNYEIFLPDDDETSLEFEGLVTNVKLNELNTSDAITCDVTIKVTGKPTINSGSGSSK